MAYPLGEAKPQLLRVEFDRRVGLEIHGSDISSGAGVFPPASPITRLDRPNWAERFRRRRGAARTPSTGPGSTHLRPSTGRVFDRQIGSTKRRDRHAACRIRTGFAFGRHACYATGDRK